MWYEDPAVVAGGVMLLAVAAAATFLHHPLTGVLGEYAGSRTRGRFWASMAVVVLVAVPLGVIVHLAAVPDTPRAFSLGETLALLKWGLVGLVAAVGLLACAVGVFARRHGATVVLDADDASDLSRLLMRIKELRAREFLEQIEREKE
jgi:putative ubiquitin-RnfH superfamily antitoxin RatB of RatAB toxin-antitoxin module